MPPKNLKIRSNAVQCRMLIDYMSQHPRFANREFDGPLGANRYEAQWEALAKILREHGPDKSVQAWKVTWRDLSRKARQSNAAVNRARVQTGNTVEIPGISEDEQLILAAIGRDTSEGVGPEESRIGDIEDYVNFSGARNSVASSTFAENFVVIPTPATATVTAPCEQHFSASHLSSSPSPSASPARSMLSILPTSPALLERPSLAARPTPYTRPAITAQPARLVLPARQLHSSMYVDPRPARVHSSQPARPRDRTTEPAPSTAQFNQLQQEHNNILRDILNELKSLNETQKQKLEVLKERNDMLANRINTLEETEIIENLEDTEIMEEEDV